MRREHARLVGRIIFSDLLEYPLERYKKMIEEVETSPLMSRLPVTFKYLSQPGPACPLAKRQREGWACEGDKGSSRVIAEIVKNGRALKIRYTCEGFNKKFWISDCGMWNVEQNNLQSEIQNPQSEIDRFLYRLRRIGSRNELTYQVLKGIIKHQGKYLRTGNPPDLDPLTQVDLAKAISSGNSKIDNSWISRLICGLTVLTPSGEEKALKFFFPSQKQVNKFFIKDLLDRERRDMVSGRVKEPYSDEQIREMVRMRNVYPVKFPADWDYLTGAECGIKRSKMQNPKSKINNFPSGRLLNAVMKWGFPLPGEGSPAVCIPLCG